MNPIKNNSNAENEQTEPTSLSAYIGTVKHKLADWLTHQTEKLSTPGKKITLLLFGTIMASTSILLITKSFQVTTVDASILPQAIEVPLVIPPSEGIMMNEEYEMLLQFTHMMDSLKSTPEGSVIHDSILRDRPGLMDSINFLIQIYHGPKRF